MNPSRSSLPEDAAEWTSVSVSFPRLKDDSASSCPETVEEIMAYVRTESGDTNNAEQNRLSFLRTAQIAKCKYWLWRYQEYDGAECFVVFRLKPDGSTSLGLSETNGLSPEQYLLAEQYDKIYWS